MTWEELIAAQEKDLADYGDRRRATRTHLYADQLELVGQCCVTPKSVELIRGIIDQQRDQWRLNEKDELDALLDAHQKERENFKKKEIQRQRLDALLKVSREKVRER